MLKKRKLGPDVWVHRYMDAEGIQKSERIGTVENYPTTHAHVYWMGRDQTSTIEELERERRIIGEIDLMKGEIKT